MNRNRFLLSIVNRCRQIQFFSPLVVCKNELQVKNHLLCKLELLRDLPTFFLPGISAVNYGVETWRQIHLETLLKTYPRLNLTT